MTITTTTTTKKLEIGDKAPDFNLLDQNGKEVSLGNFGGEKNVVLYFYPRAMTPGCTVQACGIRDGKRSFSSKQTVVFGVSPDPVECLKKFEQKQDLNFSLLSDEEKTVIKGYGAWGPKSFMGKKFDGVLRITFIIGKDGKIKHIMDKVKTKTHHEDVLDFIKENL